MRPDDDLRLDAAPAQMLAQQPERFRHVPVAEVPRLDAVSNGRAVVRLGVLDDARILLGIEGRVGIESAIAPRVFAGGALQLDQLGDDLTLARGVQTEPRRRRVVVGIPPK